MSEVNKELIPLLVTRGIIVFPGCSEQLDVGRLFSMNAVTTSLNSFDGRIVICSQKDPNKNEINLDSIYQYGSLCNISSVREQKGFYRIKITALSRVKLKDTNLTLVDDADYMKTDFDVVETINDEDVKIEETLMSQIVELLSRFGATTLPPSVINKLQKGITSEELSNQLCQYFPISLENKQKMLEEKEITARLRFIYQALEEMKDAAEIEKNINRRVREKTDKQQKEYILREKLKATQDELNQMMGNDEEDEEQEILRKLEEQDYPEEVSKKIKKELQRYKQMPGASLEASMAKTYIDWLVDLPWSKKTEDNDSLENVVKVLDEDHYGLEKVKDRIIEYLAVKSVTNSLKAPIICLYGPPGVGKTSLARSVARALGRKFVKASLGGLYDESEIRGNRRTYLGANPGKIIQSMRKAGSINPVFLIDEIDKMTKDQKGDPAAALLEVLDPEQTFQDNFLEEEYDLSNVMFIATANDLENIPGPLRDRLEIIELKGYTELEKLDIAKKHLIPSIIKEHGLLSDNIKFDDEIIIYIINHYTKEAGVRELRRQISKIIRKIVTSIVTTNIKVNGLVINKNNIEKYLGRPKYFYNHNNINQLGVVNALTYTNFGGEVLPVEISYFKGNGQIILTGNLGDVLKESAKIAISYLKVNAKKFNIDYELLCNSDIHIHIPQGESRKEGPSAGITITTALISIFTNNKIPRNYAMTGEISLRGNVLPIGSLREKTIGAVKHGIDTIFIPDENSKDLENIPDEIKQNVKFIPVKNYIEIYNYIFKKKENK